MNAYFYEKQIFFRHIVQRKKMFLFNFSLQQPMMHQGRPMGPQGQQGPQGMPRFPNQNHWNPRQNGPRPMPNGPPGPPQRPMVRVSVHI